MSELYSEFLVKKESTFKDALIKFGMIGLTVVAVAAGLFLNPLLLIVAIGLGVACYFIIPKTDHGKIKKKKSKIFESYRGRPDRSSEFSQNGLL